MKLHLQMTKILKASSMVFVQWRRRQRLKVDTETYVSRQLLII